MAILRDSLASARVRMRIDALWIVLKIAIEIVDIYPWKMVTIHSYPIKNGDYP